MKPRDLMRLIIDKPETVRWLLLTNNQIRIVKFCSESNGGLPSFALSCMLQISIQNASTQLSRLYQKGYLKRKEVIQESGGVEYVYESAI